MVMECPECCSCNNNDANFCSSCGIQLRVNPPMFYPVSYQSAPPVTYPVPSPAPVAYPSPSAPPVVYPQSGSYESLRRAVEELSTRNQNLERTLLDQNRHLEADLENARSEVRNLETQVKAGEAAHKREEARIGELVEENRQLAQRTSRTPRTGAGIRFCERCGRRLTATADPGVMSCQICCVTYR